MMDQRYVVSESSMLMLSVYELTPKGARPYCRIKLDIDTQPVSFTIIGVASLSPLTEYAKEQVHTWITHKCSTLGISATWNRTLSSYSAGLIPYSHMA